MPLAKTMDEQINRLRHWAEGRARNASVWRDPLNPVAAKPATFHPDAHVFLGQRV